MSYGEKKICTCFSEMLELEESFECLACGEIILKGDNPNRLPTLEIDSFTTHSMGVSSTQINILQQQTELFDRLVARIGEALEDPDQSRRELTAQVARELPFLSTSERDLAIAMGSTRTERYRRDNRLRKLVNSSRLLSNKELEEIPTLAILTENENLANIAMRTYDSEKEQRRFIESHTTSFSPILGDSNSD